MRTHVITLWFALGAMFAQSQTFTCGIDSVADIDGNYYHTVWIGNRCWMKENMNATRYADGVSVGMRQAPQDPELATVVNTPGYVQLRARMAEPGDLEVVVYDLNGILRCRETFSCSPGDYNLDITLGPAQPFLVTVNHTTMKALGIDGGRVGIGIIGDYRVPRLKSDTVFITDSSRNYFDYDNDPANGPRLGKLYTLVSAFNMYFPAGQSVPAVIQGVCPNGWHVSNDSDWIDLETAAGMSPGQISGMFEYRGTVSYKFKTTGIEFWLYGNGTDELGFSAKGGGLYTCEPGFCYFDLYRDTGRWWTYSDYFDFLMIREICATGTGVWRSYYVGHNNAFSVRCVKDE